MENRNEEKKLIELIVRILFDVKPSSRADAVYIFAQTSDNQKNLFDATLNLYKNKDTDKIVICGEDEKTGYPGFHNWQVRLISLGINQKDVVGLKSIDGKINTLTSWRELKNIINRET